MKRPQLKPVTYPVFITQNFKEMDKIKNMIIQKFLGREETEDLMLNYLFYTEEEIDKNYPEWVSQGGDPRSGNNTPMPIDDALRIIQEMKDKGANFIEIDYHCDHITYLFSGFEIRKATEEEIKEEQKRLDDIEKSNRLKRLNELKEEIEKINNEVQ